MKWSAYLCWNLDYLSPMTLIIHGVLKCIITSWETCIFGAHDLLWSIYVHIYITGDYKSFHWKRSIWLLVCIWILFCSTIALLLCVRTGLTSLTTKIMRNYPSWLIKIRVWRCYVHVHNSWYTKTYEVTPVDVAGIGTVCHNHATPTLHDATLQSYLDGHTLEFPESDEGALKGTCILPKKKQIRLTSMYEWIFFFLLLFCSILHWALTYYYIDFLFGSRSKRWLKSTYSLLIILSRIFWSTYTRGRKWM